MKRIDLALYALLAVPALGEGTADTVALQESLRRTEIAFAATVRDKDPAAFLSFVAEDAVFVSGETRRGREAIGRAWSDLFEPEAETLFWEPARVEVLAGGDLGLSTGPWWIAVRGEDGKKSTLRGRFFSVWRRDEAGAWKIVFDSGTEGQVEEGPADGPEEAATRPEPPAPADDSGRR